MNETLKFETKMTNYEMVNSEFMRVKINICYAGKNRNNSIIEKSVLDNLAKTVYGVPVVGEIDQSTMKFKGHGGLIEISDEGVVEKKTTIPYGFVDPSTPFYYEKILEDDGITYNDYLTVGCYLWRGRYPELKEIFENNKVKQSMEIMVNDGEWDDNYEWLTIKDATFTALCMLGVEPCFESSKVQLGYSLENREAMYQEMLDRFKQFTLDMAGGEEMQQETTSEVTNEQAEVEVENVTTELEEAEVETEELEQEVSTTEEEVAVAEENVDGEVQEEKEEVIDYQVKYETLVNEYAELETKYATLVKESVEMKEEYTRLVDFEANVLLQERKENEKQLFETLSQLITNNEELVTLFENSSNLSLEELETKGYAIVGKQALFTLKPQKQQKVVDKLKFETTQVESKIRPYGGLLD